MLLTKIFCCFALIFVFFLLALQRGRCDCDVSKIWKHGCQHTAAASNTGITVFSANVLYLLELSCLYLLSAELQTWW